MVGNSEFFTSNVPSETSEFQDLDSPEGELYLRFYVPSGNEFALSAIGIREVLDVTPEKITPIPNASPLLLGTINWRGQVLWVADLGQFLGDNNMINTERPELSVIVIEYEETLIGVAVERIDMDWLDIAQIEPVVNAVSDTMTPYLRGEWILHLENNKSLRLLDHGAIIRSARWGAT
jgi:purine-binding chemotaxis protein CheW